MRAIEASGPRLDKLHVVEWVKPTPERGEILIGTTAATLNYRDPASLKGSYRPNLRYAYIPVSDDCGAGKGLARDGRQQPVLVKRGLFR